MPAGGAIRILASGPQDAQPKECQEGGGKQGPVRGGGVGAHCQGAKSQEAEALGLDAVWHCVCLSST